MPLIKKLRNKKLLLKSWKKILRSKNIEIRKVSRGVDEITIQHFYENQNFYLKDLFYSLSKDNFSLSKLKGRIIKQPSKDKDRFITIQNIKDKIIHTAIRAIITPLVYPYINTEVSHCGISKNVWRREDTEEILSTKSAMYTLIKNMEKKKYWVLKSDISSFFDNIPKKRLLNKIQNILPDTSLNNIIKQIIYFKIGNIDKFKGNPRIKFSSSCNGISQGSPLSPLFSNIYLSKFDLKMKGLFGTSFIRYADDFIIFFSQESDAKNALTILKKLLAQEGLELSSEKTQIKNIKTHSIEFLGLNINRNKISSKKSKEIIMREIESILNFKNKKYSKLNKSKTIKKMNATIRGIFNFYKNYHIEDLVNKVDDYIKIKMKYPRYNKLKLIKDSIKLSPIIPIDIWKSYF